MKSMVLVSIVLFLVAPWAWSRASAPAFEPDDVAVDWNLPEGWVKMDAASLEPLETSAQYQDAAHTIQARYTYFRQSRDDISDLKTQFQLYLFEIVQKLAGRGGNIKQSTDVRDAEARSDWGATSAKRFLIVGSPTDYSEGFRFLQVTFYLKEGTGIVCQSLLFNEEGLVGSAALATAARTFRFPN